jgi:PHP family Zn ribbon phosphoesterase
MVVSFTLSKASSKSLCSLIDDIIKMATKDTKLIIGTIDKIHPSYLGLHFP